MGCSVCGQSLEWHEEHHPRHQYTEEGGPMQVPKEVPHQPVPRGGDVVLRMALLKAGVVSEVELAQAQLWVERGAEQGHALVVEPDPDHPGENRFRLLPFTELVASLVKS